MTYSVLIRDRESWLLDDIHKEAVVYVGPGSRVRIFHPSRLPTQLVLVLATTGRYTELVPNVFDRQ